MDDKAFTVFVYDEVFPDLNPDIEAWDGQPVFVRKYGVMAVNAFGERYAATRYFDTEDEAARYRYTFIDPEVDPRESNDWYEHVPVYGSDYYDASGEEDAQIRRERQADGLYA